MEWDVPGLDLVELIGFGAIGEVWRAVERSSGQVVAVRWVETGEALPEVRRRAASLRAIRSEHLVRVRSATDCAVVLDHAAGGSLASLLARRGALSPGEVVTVVAPLALALAEAHDRGLAHGRLTPREVLLTADGKPLLDGLALCFLYDEKGAPTEDVQALGRLAQDLLDGSAPPAALAAAIALALAPGTTAHDVGQALLVCCQAEPLAGLSPPDPLVLQTLPAIPTVPQPRRRGRPAVFPTLLLATLLLATLVVATGTAASLRSAGQEPAPLPAAQPSPAVTPSAWASLTPAVEVAWGTVLDRLDQARAAAYAAADPLALAQVYVEVSAAFTADRLVLARLTAARRTARGLRHRVSSLRAVRISDLQVALHVTQTLVAHDLISPTGEVERRPAGPTVARVVALRRTAAGWRVDGISGPAGAG